MPLIILNGYTYYTYNGEIVIFIVESARPFNNVLDWCRK